MCNQVAYCKSYPYHLERSHQIWCEYYTRFKKIIEFQEKFGKLSPVLPTKILNETKMCDDNEKVFNKLSCGEKTNF